MCQIAVFNLKFRGLQEKLEENSDVYSCMVFWLSGLLNLGERTSPIITLAYRLGCLSVPLRSQPRDVVVTFTDIAMKNRILDMAKDKGHLLFKDEHIQVFKELAPEALAKKRELKEILAMIWDAHLRHRWASPVKLQLFFKGQSYFIRSEEGFDILQSLGIATPMATDRSSAKRKLALQGSPTHAAKKTHKNSSR